MKTFVPEYYKKFNCIADKCKHSCCTGWEIDIDEYTYDLYKKHNGKLKSHFEEYISNEGSVPHFKLDKDERCPFLNNRNLCDIYIELGEEYLCQICTDHPRFRNYFSDRTEIGLGLCCEEACRIILKNTDYYKMIELDDDDFPDEISDEESEFFGIRQKIFDILQQRDICFLERCKNLIEFLGIRNSNINFTDIYSNLEYMENDISGMLNNNVKIPDCYLEQLCIYFIYRHLAASLDDGRICERVLFSVISSYVVEKMCKNNTLEEICECARIYSSEIEYSEENTESILNYLTTLLHIAEKRN